MPDWYKPDEAIRYLGLEDIDDLERAVVEYDIEVEVTDGGQILLVNAEECKEPLFEEHHKKVGHRPDDPTAQAQALEKRDKQEAADKTKRKERRNLLHKRMEMRNVRPL